VSEILSGGSERPMLIGLVFIAGIVILAFWLANLVSWHLSCRTGDY
jgi:hypothetical protein